MHFGYEEAADFRNGGGGFCTCYCCVFECIDIFFFVRIIRILLR